MRIIDISIPIKKGMPVWPKSLKPHLRQVFSHKKGDLCTQTEINMDLHTGTHIDAPLHCIGEGAPIDKLKLETMVGPAFVAYLPKVKTITSEILGNINLPRGISRLLFKTSNSEFWVKKETKFQKKFVALTPDGAQWLADHDIELVGNDYLSVGIFSNTGKDQAEVHRILLEKSIVLLEGLDLSGVKPGIYQLICLPIKLINTEAGPVRAVLMPLRKKI